MTEVPFTRNEPWLDAITIVAFALIVLGLVLLIALIVWLVD